MKTLRKLPPKFKFCSYTNVNVDDIRRMVNEIEEGVYMDRNEEVQQFNNYKNTKKTGKFEREGDSYPALLDTTNYYENYKMGKIVETRKRMPQFSKINRVPNPDSNVFTDFEKFL
jgi:hypothetical protein